jgi:hypothetical protein
MRPDGAITNNGCSMDLSYTAMEEASKLLPRSAFYLLTVHPAKIRDAARLLGIHAKTMDENPLAPAVGLNCDPAFQPWEWTMAAEGAVFWSPGA